MGRITLAKKNSQSTSIKSEVTRTWGLSAPELENYGDHSIYNFYLCDVYSVAMVLLRTCGFPSDRLREIPKVLKKYHDLDFREEIFPELKKNSYSDKLITLVKMMSAFDPAERITLHEVINYLDRTYK